jgi:hypothetical protein
MSVISTIYNQGTGLINPIGEGASLPIIVDDLVVNGNLTVLGTSQLIGDTAIDSNVTVAMTTTTEDLIVNNNTVLNNGVGHDNTALFKLPLTNGINGEVLTITNDAVNPILTDWQPNPIINDYVQYDTGTSKLKNNFLSTVSNINDITVDNSIGLTGQRFKLPSNTTTAINSQVLAISNASLNPKTTAWVTIPSQFIITQGVVENQFTGVLTASGNTYAIINTPLLTSGFYIINYEIRQSSTTTRAYTYQSVGISNNTSFSGVLGGLNQASLISYTSPVNLTAGQEPKMTGCGVIFLFTSQTLYLVTLNNFTGANYVSFGSIRFTKLS